MHPENSRESGERESFGRNQEWIGEEKEETSLFTVSDRRDGRRNSTEQGGSERTLFFAVGEKKERDRSNEGERRPVSISPFY
jgi:hypothetical protein